jgi:hypothetical protein
MDDDLDTQIGEALNLSFTWRWYAMNKEETAWYIDFGSQREADEWLNRELTRRPDGRLTREGAHIVKRKEYPLYSHNLQDAQLVVDEMGRRGFWLILKSPFVPNEEHQPANPVRKAWETTKMHWFASFDFHGLTGTNPLWKASSENPAEAIVLAALQCIEGNPDIFLKSGRKTTRKKSVIDFRVDKDPGKPETRRDD